MALDRILHWVLVAVFAAVTVVTFFRRGRLKISPPANKPDKYFLFCCAVILAMLLPRHVDPTAALAVQGVGLVVVVGLALANVPDWRKPRQSTEGAPASRSDPSSGRG